LNLPYTGSVSVKPEAMQIELDSVRQPGYVLVGALSREEFGS
jgi:hypothetical protein